jgi:hypothetical protein
LTVNRVEKLVFWYLRFNDYFTNENFTVHTNFKRDLEADALDVRFPLSTEDPRWLTFERDQNLILNNRIDFTICEVKLSLCDIYLSWEDPDHENILYGLRWCNDFPEKDIGTISNAIY